MRLERRINSLISIAAFEITLFTSNKGDLNKNKDVLKFDYNKKPIVISLKESDLDLALEVLKKINRRIEKTHI